LTGPCELKELAFSELPQCTGPEHVPLVVIGLPRSGSTYLSHVLSCIEDWFIFDDLYLLRKAVSIDAADGALNRPKFNELNDFMRWQVKARVIFEQNFLSLDLTEQQVDQLHDLIDSLFEQKVFSWSELMGEWLTRIAYYNGSKKWGYKAPQDFMNIALIRDVYPGVKFIHLVRDPRKILSSFKYLNGEDGSYLQYHPYVYSKYWLMAALTVNQWKQKGVPIKTVLFEELIKSPAVIAREVADFIGAKMKYGVPDMGANTSFSGKSSKAISSLEERLCEKITAEALTRYGYKLSSVGAVSVVDYLELLWITIRFGSFQVYRFIKEKDKRASIVLYVKNFTRNFFSRDNG
jgi:hypothetical protein